LTLAIGVDIGGTKVAAGVVDADGQVIDRERRDTPGQDAAQTESTIVELVEALAARHEVSAVGIGAAGWIANDHSTVLFAPHLAWRNEPLREALRSRIARPLIVENDANAAAWAEYRFGAAQGEKVVVCVTLGTGIGGGLVIDGGAPAAIVAAGRCTPPGGPWPGTPASSPRSRRWRPPGCSSSRGRWTG
jgi:glucokinase